MALVSVKNVCSLFGLSRHDVSTSCVWLGYWMHLLSCIFVSSLCLLNWSVCSQVSHAHIFVVGKGGGVVMKTLRYGRISFRCIRYFEILKFTVYSLFWDFFSSWFHHKRTYTERMHPKRTPHARPTHSRQRIYPYERIKNQSRKRENSFVRAALAWAGR